MKGLNYRSLVMNSAALIRSISIAQETCVTYIAVCVDDIDVLGQEHEEGAASMSFWSF